jgi:hypothetical protein
MQRLGDRFGAFPRVLADVLDQRLVQRRLALVQVGLVDRAVAACADVDHELTGLVPIAGANAI